ncbi:zinc finger and BTB domain-containing protein 17-like isoform X1 [Salvelinus fontinalis]|uniref:zinc finger and BTB domain-containing protein 17-like isoform X1 n=1 Tax=Salvelinus fontinalis TaxID=8038 RepID=UPI002485BA18|nr:zinc finger and BTB domain-containing protein 17-like isoform X1 [Salvelinus fontinalis]
MPVWCSVPYCANYKLAQKEGVIFHSLPTGDIPRCRKWLAAIKNNIYNVNTPVAKYQNIRVCSQHFRPEDYLRDYQSELMGKPNRRQLKRDAIPSVFSFTTKRKTSDQPTPAQKKRSRLEYLKSIEALITPEVAPILPGRKNKGVLTRPRVQDSGTSIDITPESADVCVNRVCLMQLFLLCERCGCDCDARIQDELGCFSVVQTCPFCSHHRKWMSQPSFAQETCGLNEEAVGGTLSQPCEDRDPDLENICLTMEITEELCEHDSRSSDEESEEDEKPKKRNKQERSDETEWEPSDEEDIVMDSGSSEDLETAGSSGLTEKADVDNSQSGIEKEERLVEWCTDCGAEPVLACTTQRHKKLYACGVCVSEVQQAVGFDRFYMQFEDPDSFEEHVRREHNTQPHRLLCTDCGIFPHKKDHRCEHKIKKFRCVDCGKRCRTETGIKIHRHLHHPDHVFPCKFCLQPFKTRSDKLTHEESHQDENSPYQCSECSEKFNDLMARNSHLRTHSNLNRNICHTCYKEFSNKNHLERHVIIHTRQKPHMCQVCQQSFNQASHLKSHMRLHTGERPFKCQLCEKCFNHNVSLKNHIQRYHGPEESNTG